MLLAVSAASAYNEVIDLRTANQTCSAELLECRPMLDDCEQSYQDLLLSCV